MLTAPVCVKAAHQQSWLHACSLSMHCPGQETRQPGSCPGHMAALGCAHCCVAAHLTPPVTCLGSLRPRRLVVKMFRWFDSVGGGGPLPHAEFGADSSAMASQDAIYDRWEQHVRKCPACRDVRSLPLTPCCRCASKGRFPPRAPGPSADLPCLPGVPGNDTCSEATLQ